MNHNRYRCTFTGTYQLEANRGQSRMYTHNDVYARWPYTADMLKNLETGETLIDQDGDTWERIA